MPEEPTLVPESETQPNLEQQVVTAREDIQTFMSGLRYRENENDWHTQKTRQVEDTELPELDQKIKVLAQGLGVGDYRKDVVEDLRRLVQFQYSYGKSQNNAKIEEMTFQAITNNTQVLEDIFQDDRYPLKCTKVI